MVPGPVLLAGPAPDPHSVVCMLYSCSYGRFLVRFYWLVLLLTLVVAVTCIAVAFTVKDFPSLDEPTRVSVHPP